MNIFEKPLFEMKYINVEYIFYHVYLFFKRIFGGGESNIDYSNTSNVEKVSSDVAGNSAFSFDFSLLGDIFKFILFLLIIFLLILITYILIRMTEIRKKEHDYLHEELHKYKEMQEKKQQKIEDISKNSKWVNVVKYMNTNDENNWKLAIIEADLILDSLLNSLGFSGETLGDKLKSVDKDKYKVLNKAWDAHRIRNRIAHEGGDFIITHNEAKNTIGTYEEIFRYYNYI